MLINAMLLVTNFGMTAVTFLDLSINCMLMLRCTSRWNFLRFNLESAFMQVRFTLLALEVMSLSGDSALMNSLLLLSRGLRSLLWRSRSGGSSLSLSRLLSLLTLALFPHGMEVNISWSLHSARSFLRSLLRGKLRALMLERF